MRRIGSDGDGPGHFMYPVGVAHGAGGEIIVSDNVRKDVQVFSGEGELLQIIGADGDSKVALHGTPHAVAADAEGRIVFTTKGRLKAPYVVNSTNEKSVVVMLS